MYRDWTDWLMVVSRGRTRRAKMGKTHSSIRCDTVAIPEIERDGTVEIHSHPCAQLRGRYDAGVRSSDVGRIAA